MTGFRFFCLGLKANEGLRNIETTLEVLVASSSQGELSKSGFDVKLVSWATSSDILLPFRPKFIVSTGITFRLDPIR